MNFTMKVTIKFDVPLPEALTDEAVQKDPAMVVAANTWADATASHLAKNLEAAAEKTVIPGGAKFTSAKVEKVYHNWRISIPRVKGAR